MKNVVYFKQKDGYFRCLDIDNNNISVIKRLPRETHRYELSKGYDATDDGLRKYLIDFNDWCDELVTYISNGEIFGKNSIEYKSKFATHNCAVIGTFKRYCKGKYEHHDKIEYLESTYMEACHNGGLTYFIGEEGNYESYGYDFSSFFATILSSEDFLIPDKRGKEVYLTELTNDIKLGFYRCKITSSNPNCKKIFAFSSSDTYTSTSLSFALENKEEFNINIELIIDDKPNAYIYDSYVTGKSIFSMWFNRLHGHFKKKYPKNKLVKKLLSQVWGQICQKNSINISYNDMIDQGLSVSLTGKDTDYKIINYYNNCQSDQDDKEYYELQLVKEPYRYNLRIKSFLLSYSRNKIAKIAMRDIDSVLRIQTDNVTFNKPMDFKDVKDFLPEDKTTGLIHWQNVNKYKKV
jgi:hypothetical protein